MAARDGRTTHGGPNGAEYRRSTGALDAAEPAEGPDVVATDAAILLSITDASRRLGLRRSSFYEHVLRPGRLNTVRIGRRRLVHRDDLAAFAETLRSEANDEASWTEDWQL